MGLAPTQIEHLMRPLYQGRVQRDAKGMSHLAAWDVRRYMIRIFGPAGWKFEVLSCEFVSQTEGKTKQNRDAWEVIYRAMARLTIKDPAGKDVTFFEDGAIGNAFLPSLADAHDMAMKTAMSQALKRCAMNLGDQFGLSLYNNGSTDAVVGSSLAHPSDGQVDATESVEGDAEIAAPDSEVSQDPEGDLAKSQQALDAALKDLTTAKTMDDLQAVTQTIMGLKRDHVLAPAHLTALQDAWKAQFAALATADIEQKISKVDSQDDYDKVLELINTSSLHEDIKGVLIRKLDGHIAQMLVGPADGR